MKKMIFAAVATIFMSGCAEMPKQETADAGFKEESITMTGSRIPRKSSNTAHAGTRIVDKEALERQVQNQATINGGGR
jgi:hypothetical protein